MKGRLLKLASIALLLAACDREAVSTAVLVDLPVGHTITAESAGPIDGTTDYSTTALGRFFPGAEMETTRTADETGVVEAIAIYEEGAQVFQVLPNESGTEIRAVHGTGVIVSGPGGERPGTVFADTALSRDDCVPGEGPWSGMAVCRHPDTANVRFVFGDDGWNGSGALPPNRMLARGQLHRIVWEPSGAS